MFKTSLQHVLRHFHLNSSKATSLIPATLKIQLRPQLLCSSFQTFANLQQTGQLVQRSSVKCSFNILECVPQRFQMKRHGVRLYSSASSSSQLPKKSGKLEAIQKHISPLASKRPLRKKLGKDQAVDKDVFNAIAFAAAEEIHLETLKVDLAKQGLYEVLSLPSDIEDSIHVRARYQVEKEPREFFIFREGAIVFWNLPKVERKEVLKFLTKHQEDSYSRELVSEEKEEMDYVYTEAATKLSGDEIHLQRQPSNAGDESTSATIVEKTALEKYAFSNALSLSVKLSIWEASLSQYVDSIQWVTEDLKDGNQIKMSRADVMKKTGELFTLRHLINLSSDLLDTPDFYWDRPELEDLYLKSCTYLYISRRTRVMNEKLTYCCELAERLTTHLNDQHHTRLEWMIIVLILVEVVFETVHLVERYL